MDTIIKDVMIYDGLGSIPFLSNLYIEHNKISKISNQEVVEEGNIIIDGTELAVCPGFIDIHSHSDLEIFKKEKQNHAIRQGITTEVIGQDGISAAPCDSLVKEYLYDKVMMFSGKTEEKTEWSDFKKYKKSILESEYDVKIENLIGHGTARMLISNEDRKLTDNEIEEMKNIVKNSLVDGAKGVSISLVNAPSSFGDEDEIVEICKVVSEYDGIAMMYFGDDQKLLLESIDFIARVGRKSNCRMHISQLKAAGNRNYGKIDLALEKINKYVKEGIDISFDCYPYIAINSLISILLGKNSCNISEIFENEDLYINSIKEIENNIQSYGGDENIIITSFSGDKSIIGKKLKEIRNQMGICSGEIILKLLKEDDNALALFFSINSNDLETLLIHPLTCICTDSIISDFPHPRVYGSFPRLLGNYARKMKLISMEEIIRKMTSEPARRLRLWDRGIIREGMAADIVLFDPQKIKDGNSYMNPKKYPIGIKAVWVDGIMKYADLG